MLRKRTEYIKAVKLRKKGYSLSEISRSVGISKSTASLWCRGLVLSQTARKLILLKSIQGRIKACRVIQRKREKARHKIKMKANQVLANITFNKNIFELLCSIMYICEGDTNLSFGVGFTNSDPGLVRLYLRLFRKSFKLDESKFKVCVHLHGYHNKTKQLDYWSKVTRIPLDQFIKPYRKKNTGKRIRENYQGCVSIRYYDSMVARELRFLYLAFLKKTEARGLTG